MTLSPRQWRVVDADWNHWPDGLDDTAIWQAAVGAGVAGVELGVYDAAVDLSRERLDGLRRLTTGSVPVSSILLSLPAERWPDGALTGTPVAVTALVAQVTRCAARASDLGLDMLGLWPGADPPGRDARAALARCRDAAAVRGVRLAVEYKPGTVVADCAQALGLAADVPGTRVLLDTGHAWAAGEDPADCVRALADLLGAVHLGDAHPSEADDDLPLGTVHDPAALVAALDDVGYAGTAAFDLYGCVTSGRWTGAAATSASLAALASAGVGT